MRATHPTMLPVLCLLLSSLLVSFTSAYSDANPPYLKSVTENCNSNGCQINWLWCTTSKVACDSDGMGNGMCYMTLVTDNDNSNAITYGTNRAYDDNSNCSDSSSTYSFTSQVPLNIVPGPHNFTVKEASFNFNLVPSNTITINVVPFTPPVVVPPPSLTGDPVFNGLRGQIYQVHGTPNEVFNIISDTDLQYNARFVLLESGECPTLNGVKLDTECFSHTGTYLGELGVETSAGDRIMIVAGAASQGFSRVMLNGIKVAIGEMMPLKALEGRSTPFLMLKNTHQLTIQAGNFRLDLTNSDFFVNQLVSMIEAEAESSHGLLGQSWSTAVYNPKATIPWIEGRVSDYMIEDHRLFSRRFTFNKFHHEGVQEGDEERTTQFLDAKSANGGEMMDSRKTSEYIKTLIAKASHAKGMSKSKHHGRY